MSREATYNSKMYDENHEGLLRLSTINIHTDIQNSVTGLEPATKVSGDSLLASDPVTFRMWAYPVQA